VCEHLVTKSAVLSGIVQPPAVSGSWAKSTLGFRSPTTGTGY